MSFISSIMEDGMRKRVRPWRKKKEDENVLLTFNPLISFIYMFKFN